jgi:hypothetical protein
MRIAFIFALVVAVCICTDADPGKKSEEGGCSPTAALSTPQSDPQEPSDSQKCPGEEKRAEREKDKDEEQNSAECEKEYVIVEPSDVLP